MAIEAHVGTFVMYEEVFDHRPTYAEFQARLRAYKRNSVVFICSAINCLLKGSGEVDVDAHDRLIREAFAPQQANRLLILCTTKNPRRFALHRRQALLLCKEAIKVCNEDGIDPGAGQFWSGLGELLLMASNFLHFDLNANRTQPDKLSLLAELVPVVEYGVGIGCFMGTVARSHLMATTVVESLKEHPLYLDFSSMLQAACGLSLNEYETLCTGFMALYLTLTYDKYVANPLAFVVRRSEWYRGTTFDAQKADRFFEQLISTANDLRSRIEKRDCGTTDFTWMRDRPFFDEGGRVYPFDPFFVADKLEDGAFWAVHGTLKTGKERMRLHAFWGLVFERYVHLVIGNAIDGDKNVFYPSPNYRGSKNEACDGLVVCGDTAVLIECKGSTFTANAKYSGDVNCLREEIEGKLVGTKEERKGVLQLADAIKNLFDKCNPRKLDCCDLDGIRKVVPLLITRDGIGGTFLINSYLNARFLENLNRKKYRPRIITPLFVMSSENLERISGHLADMPMTDILEMRYAIDDGLVYPFQHVIAQALQSKPIQRLPLISDTYREVFTTAVEALFPGKKLDFSGLTG
jgi:hypothetical protein